MAGFSDYAENAVLNSIFGRTSDLGVLASAPTIYIALCRSAPTDLSTGSDLDEPSGNNYSRLTTDSSSWSDAASGTISNAIALDFAQASGSWGTISHVALVDDIATGNVILYGQLDNNIVVGDGSTVRFDSGTLDISLD